METNQMQMQNMLANAQQQPMQEEPAAPQTEENATELKLRAQELITQARTIWAVAHVDVMALYNTDVEVRTRVLEGTWDFIDVYKAMKPVAAPPAPVRNANGGVGGMNISGMSGSQFEKLNEMLSRGVKVDMR